MKTSNPTIAYFSMEIALEDGIPTYSGGLGVLAGDLLRTAADLGLPLVGVTLASRLGYFRQRIVGGAQHEDPEPWDPAARAERLPCKVLVQLEGREVWVGAWRYWLRSDCPGADPVPILLLDTDMPGNAPQDRGITDHLYGGDAAYRLRQEAVLGIGGVRLLDALGIHVGKFHLNEGHSALLALELLRRLRPAADGGPDMEDAVAAVRERCIFTTHTPVAAGHDRYPHALVERVLGATLPLPVLRSLGGANELNLTGLALALSGWVNGVAKRHAETSRALYPRYQVHAVTNGVHPLTWTAAPWRALFDRHVPGWCHEPERLQRALALSDDEVLQAHRACRQALLSALSPLPGGAGLSQECATLVFARRMTAYKRPGLLFSDLERLRGIARRLPFQVIVAGKAHPRDEEGREAVEHLHAWARALAPDVPVVFVPDYRIEMARLLVAGADVWLNTPRPPLEASGTSGMKAALNGVPSLSVLDGWWVEGCAEGITGWAIGAGDVEDDATHADSLYRKLEQDVLPAWHGPSQAWCGIMKSCIARNGSFFNSHRMLRRYACEAYWR